MTKMDGLAKLVLERKNNRVSQANVAADILIEAIRDDDVSSMLELMGTIADEGMTAIDLINEIRNKLK